MGFLFKKVGDDGCEYVSCKGGCGKDIIKTNSSLCMDCFSKGLPPKEEEWDDTESHSYEQLRAQLKSLSGKA
jgi:hypothetical protein